MNYLIKDIKNLYCPTCKKELELLTGSIVHNYKHPFMPSSDIFHTINLLFNYSNLTDFKDVYYICKEHNLGFRYIDRIGSYLLHGINIEYVIYKDNMLYVENFIYRNGFKKWDALTNNLMVITQILNDNKVKSIQECLNYFVKYKNLMAFI